MLNSNISLSICSTISSSGRSSRKSAVPISALHTRLSLVLAIANQTSSLTQRLLLELATETAKYVFPRTGRFENSNLEEAFMSVPDLESVEFKVLTRIPNQYEIREVKPYFIAETTMPGKNGFDFAGSSQSFNVLAEYLFGKNTKEKPMEMTTPVFTSRSNADGEKMDMTTPVITTREGKKQDNWKMSFVLPSKYGADLPLPKDSSVSIREVPKRVTAVVVFSGFVSDEEVERRESELRDLLNNDNQFRVKEGASVEVAQYNPPFTLPFNRRNEISVEVEKKQA